MAYGDIMDRLNDTRPTKDSNYNPYIPEGNHDLVVICIEPYKNQDDNFGVKATFVVEASDNPQVAQGALFDAVWNLDKPAPFVGGERDKDRFAAFLNALQGVPTTPTSHHAAARACLKPQAEGGQLESQPARGSRIKAIGVFNPPKPKRDGTMSKPYTKVSYRNVQQDPTAVVQMRQALDQRMPYTPRPQQAPQPTVPAPQPQSAPVQPAPAPSAAWTGFFPSKG